MKNGKTKDKEKLNVALVDDYLTVDGGAQKVLRVLHDMWPESAVYAATYFPDRFNPPLEGWDIRTSFVSKLPFQKQLEQQYKMFHPLGVEMFDMTGYDLVISMTATGTAKGVIVPPECVHISYVNTVPRFLWGYRTSRHERLGSIYQNLILPPIEHRWRIWDRQTSLRPDVLVANSHTIARRVWKAYRREALVIYPPVEIDRLLALEPEKEDTFIYFGRLEKYKRVDMAIRACVAAGRKLKIVGTGSYEGELRKLVHEIGGEDLVEFKGWMVTPELDEEVAKAKAFVFPGPDEDFGIVLVESLAAGTPVIAFNAGGAGEILTGNEGVLVEEFDQEALDSAVASFDPGKYTSAVCRARAKEFDVPVFKKKLSDLVSQYV